MPQLLVQTPDGAQVQHRVEGTPYRIGRQADNHLVLKDNGVSKHHCELVQSGHRWNLKDLQSANGTIVNGIRTAESALSSGDLLTVGPFRITFQDDVSDSATPTEDEDDATWVGAKPQTPPRAGGVAQLGPQGVPAPAAIPQAELEVLGGSLRGRRFPVPPHGLTLGAGAGADVVLDDPYASRRHAKVEWAVGEFRVVDMGSTNGILMEGLTTREGRLRDGSRFQIGQLGFILHWPGGPPAIVPSPFLPGAHTLGAVPPLSPPSMAVPALTPPPPASLTVEMNPAGQRRVRVGSLSFSPLMVAVMGVCVALVVVAIGAQVVRSVAPMFKTTEKVDTSAVMQAAKRAYDAGQWEQAEKLLSSIPGTDVNGPDAEAMLASIVIEKDNQKRLAVIQLLLEQGVPDKAEERFAEIPATSRYFPEARKTITDWMDESARAAVEKGRAALAVDDIAAARASLSEATRFNPEVEGLSELLTQVETRDGIVVGEEGEGVSPVRGGRVSPRSPGKPREGPRPEAVEAWRRKYLSGDVGGARAGLEELMRSPDTQVVGEAQGVLGEMDRVERNLSNGISALQKGDLDTADGRFREAMAGINGLDPQGRSPKAQEVRRHRVEERIATGQRALSAADHSTANKAFSEARRLDPGNSKVESALRQLETKAQEVYARGYVAQKDGTPSRTKEAEQWYRQVLTIAPEGEGFQYRAKAEARLRELAGGTE